MSSLRSAHMKLILVFAVIFWSVASTTSKTAERPHMKGPWTSNPSQATPAELMNSVTDTFVQGMYHFYKDTFGPAVSTGCPSYPSCSTYMLQAIQRYGPLCGTVLGLERLIHESDEMVHGRWIRVQSTEKVFDPIENNIFWWKKCQESTDD